jgi:hypothetical protein
MWLPLCALLPCLAAAADVPSQRTYATWTPWQADSVLAAWALQRYVHPEAQFESLPRGTPIPADTALDTPDSPYRRSGVRTAFEEVLRLHRVPQDPCIEKLRPIVRLLELAAWRKAEMPDAEQFETELSALLPVSPTKGGLERALEYVDRFCATAELRTSRSLARDALGKATAPCAPHPRSDGAR